MVPRKRQATWSRNTLYAAPALVCRVPGALDCLALIRDRFNRRHWRAETYAGYPVRTLLASRPPLPKRWDWDDTEQVLQQWLAYGVLQIGRERIFGEFKPVLLLTAETHDALRVIATSQSAISVDAAFF